MGYFYNEFTVSIASTDLLDGLHLLLTNEELDLIKKFSENYGNKLFLYENGFVNLDKTAASYDDINNSKTILIIGDLYDENPLVARRVIMAKENGDASIFYNTDALTLGMAMKMVAKSFVEAMHQLSEEERESVQEVLNDAAVYDKPQEVTN